MSENRCKGCSAHSVRSPVVVAEERIRLVSDFLWFGSALSIRH